MADQAAEAQGNAPVRAAADTAEEESPSNDERLRKLEAKAQLITYIVISAGVLSVIGFAGQATGWAAFMRALSVGMVLAGASLLVGALIGFLFGIPRRLQTPTAMNKEAAQPGAATERESALYGSNTNLEQISDWLTKILVGVGLVEIGELRILLRDVGEAASAGLGGAPESNVFAMTLCVYFVVCGFLCGYLATRLYLGRALTEAERDVERVKRRLSGLEQQAASDALCLQLALSQLSGEPSQRPTQTSLNEAVKAASSETRSHIFYRAQLQRWRNWREPATKEIMERTIPVFRALVASDTAGEFHANHAQLGYALKDQRNPDWAEAESSLSRAIAIRGSAQTHNEHGYEFNRAICRIMLDPEFQLGQPSKPEARARIENDLATAEHDEWVRGWLAKDTTIARWRELNKRAR